MCTVFTDRVHHTVGTTTTRFPAATEQQYPYCNDYVGRRLDKVSTSPVSVVLSLSSHHVSELPNMSRVWLNDRSHGVAESRHGSDRMAGMNKRRLDGYSVLSVCHRTHSH